MNVSPDDQAARASSFDQTAAAYEFGRPGYPRAALDWWAAHGAPLYPGARVLDLAAGTGKLTRLLCERGCEVVAVEPLANMRAELRRAVPGARVVDGRAEDIPLDDGSVDAVFVAQAFHWFDHPAALAEIARVVRPGGGLGMIWNDDDTSVPWIAAYSERKHSVGHRDDEVDWRPIVAPVFPLFDDHVLTWSETTSRDRLLANALSRSYIGVLPAEQRTGALAPLEVLLAEQPEPIEYHMTTLVCWCSPTQS